MECSNSHLNNLILHLQDLVKFKDKMKDDLNILIEEQEMFNRKNNAKIEYLKQCQKVFNDKVDTKKDRVMKELERTHSKIEDLLEILKVSQVSNLETALIPKDVQREQTHGLKMEV